MNGAHICLLNIPAHGHINPTLPVVRALVEQGARVTYFCTEPFRAAIEGQGARFVSYGDLAVDQRIVAQSGLAGPVVAANLLLEVADRLLPQLLPQVEALQPDAIVYDSMCPWGLVIARHLGRPAISSCSLFPIFSGNLAALGWPSASGLAVGQIGPAIAAVRGFGRAKRRLERQYRVALPRLPDFFASPGDLTLAYVSPELVPGMGGFDRSWKFVGSTVDMSPGDPNGAWSVPGHAPLIYVSLGTIFNERLDFFRACVQAYAERPVRVVMSIGTSLQAQDLGPVPDNIVVSARVPQLAVLAQAALFVTHAGMNSASEALWHGVPMLLTPQAGDQLFISRRIAQLGAGLPIAGAAPSREHIWALSQRVIQDPAFAARSRTLGQSLRLAGGRQRAADEILAATRLPQGI